jgi:hypothetical protein
VMHAGGRPTSYCKEILEKTLNYIENFKDFEDVIPSVASLSLVLDVNRSTLYEWASKYPEFSDMLERLNKKQEKVLLNGGLSGVMNSTITKLVLSKHDYSDKIDNKTDITSGGDKITGIQRVIVDVK